MISPAPPPIDDPAMNLIKVLSLKPFEIHVILEMEDTIERIPMVKAEIELGASISSLNSTYKFDSSFKIHAFCYNASRGSWEPFIELCTKDDVAYYPWELSIRVNLNSSFHLSSFLNIFWRNGFISKKWRIFFLENFILIKNGRFTFLYGPSSFQGTHDTRYTNLNSIRWNSIEIQNFRIILYKYQWIFSTFPSKDQSKLVNFHRNTNGVLNGIVLQFQWNSIEIAVEFYENANEICMAFESNSNGIPVFY